jgi:hypothetical protein
MDTPNTKDAIDAPGTPAGAGPPAGRGQRSRHAAFAREPGVRAPNPEPVVRVTFRTTADRSGAPLTHLTLLATSLRRVGDGSHPAAVVTAVRLAEDLGAVRIDPAVQESRRGRARAELARAAVVRAAQDLGLRVGGGAYDVGEPAFRLGTESG